MNKSTILVTGGAGYIGSHVALLLKKAGYNILILDNLSFGHSEIVRDVLDVELIIGDTNDRLLLDKIFATRNICAVMHFAAFLAVGESVHHPATYYKNNVVGTLTLLEAMVSANINKLIFSSTCSIYGISNNIPITENHPNNPLNPYASSKYMVEQILKDFDQAYNLKSVVFRYFNAAGADPSGDLGEDHTPEIHLIPLALLTALKKREHLVIFGTDYDTPDGTAIRDYIHVSDLATAHILGLEYLLSGGSSDMFNLGNGNGFSVREVIDVVKKITDVDFLVKEGKRRPGDAPILVGSGLKIKSKLNWKPQYPSLETIVDHAWKWHRKRHK
ncbi:UDP-glucose 4-epimerase GalE [Candidatus Atelocyanobacterium thalassae]|uniref:UDP-glucose 4-epimerase n=1 Tax=Atelocyanobacterium thalassa (isolate ALOHA) TaxID=1453429 RepID=D3EQ14_ATETH|nr:UDP-glucose 4-epimerase GalE [Candidatus Atelocyanobacterium thalassa]ADB95564.1 UDP-galactose 4-epimerase [Candidatus Atelocyanobacterium thalassa isolate ALOHA]MCH2543286.1 UDP-glucose 4-epimerase GalE [Candidatus Atelocyanobacterium sp. ALOHA_A2.5_9]